MESDKSSLWQDSLLGVYQGISAQIVSLAPKILAAAVLMLVGVAIAFAVRLAVRKLLESIDYLFSLKEQRGTLSEQLVRSPYADIISRVAFWIVLIIFFSVACDILGWSLFSSWMSAIVTHLPNLIAGIAVMLAGIVLGNAARNSIRNAPFSGGVQNMDLVSRSAQVAIIAIALLVSVEQIGININFLTNVILVLTGVIAAGAALAFGLGARDMIANVVGAHAFRKHCRVGEQLEIDGQRGVVIEVTDTAIILDTDAGRMLVPARLFQQQSTRVINQAPDVVGGSASPRDQDSQS